MLFLEQHKIFQTSIFKKFEKSICLDNFQITTFAPCKAPRWQV